MTKKEEKKVAKLEAECEKHDKNIKEIISTMKKMMKELDNHQPKTSDDFYAVGLNLVSAGCRMMQETLIASRISQMIFMMQSKVVQVKNGDEAKEFIDNVAKKGKEEDMSCKDGKKKPCSGKKCAGDKCNKKNAK